MSQYHFIFLEPLLQKLLPSLLKDWPRKLERFKVIQLALLQQNPKVLQDWRKPTRNSRSLFKRFDNCSGTQNSLDGKCYPEIGSYREKTYTRRISRDLRSFSILSTLEKLLVLPNIQIICSGEISPTSKPESKVRIVESGQNIRDDGLLVNIDTENLTLLVDANDTVRGFVFCGNEHGLA